MKIAKSKESLSETATVGFFSEKEEKDFGSLIKVAVPSDGDPTRVYIVECKCNRILGCIKLDKAEYFLLDRHKGLTKNQLKALIDFLTC